MDVKSMLARVLAPFRGQRSDKLHHGQMGTAEEFAALVTPADIVAARIPLDPADVPERLRVLLPLAWYWGICDDAIRDVVEEAATEEEKLEFANAVSPYNAEIRDWLDSCPVDGTMSDAAAAFMYMQLSLANMGLYREEDEAE